MNETDQRLEKLETVLMLLQRDVEQIHQSLTYHFEQLQAMEARFRRIERELELLQEPPEQRDPEHEQPPHY